jgi:crotonobetainyl-CoA:carnitine CoA-transferase CaiB-like acyl-CoA transferase
MTAMKNNNADPTTIPPAGRAPSSGPLAGVRILDLTSVVLGPFATQILGQLGADITKLETLEGDNMRHVGPMRESAMGHIHLHANQGKRSLALDLKHREGRKIALDLAARSDVLITNIRPQALARLGLDYGSLQPHCPQLIHVSCVGFDPDGPYADQPAYDDLIQGIAGLPWLMQQYGSSQPGYVPVTLSDRVTGLHAVYAATAGLYARSQSGKGQAVVVPMFEAITQFVLSDHLAGKSFEPPLGKAGYARLLTANRRPFATQDGHLCVLIYNDKHWRNFFEAIGDPERLQSPMFCNHTQRAAHIDAVYAEVGQIMKTRTTAQWQVLLAQADIPNTPMNSLDDLLNDPHLRATGFVYPSDLHGEGPMLKMRAPTRWSGTPLEPSDHGAPKLGQHSVQVLQELGYSDIAIASLLEQGICIQAVPPN